MEAYIKQAFEVWTEEHIQGQICPSLVHHLEDEALYALALPGGLENGAESDVEHLSTCSHCLLRWNHWLDTLAIVEEEEVDDDDTELAVGFLKAASASLFAEPRTLESSCGRFELTVFPDLGDTANGGMLVLEASEDHIAVRDQSLIVRDGAGQILLQGFFEDGRLAGRLENLADLDLTTWKVYTDGR